ncbi:MAG: protein phosphatase 2C domain-containing protein [Deltaproteobacteria bacterium]|nr:protein phosphatase 2C domain-containing protein [Deltaproteobacteria bacterium]
MEEVRKGTVLYHSAFGFAQVNTADHNGVRLRWEQPGENLPEHVSAANIRKVYALCPPGGFFHRAFHEPLRLQELLQVDPPTGLAQLLEDLSGPQRVQDLRDWTVGRELMSNEAFDRWWEVLNPLLIEDPRFLFEAETMSLRPLTEESSPESRLLNPHISPARRLDLALSHRHEVSRDRFMGAVLAAWREGGPQVRDLALAALRNEPADQVFQGLIGPGADSVGAVIHAIRRGGWEASDIHPETHRLLLERILRAIDGGGPLDAEGRLAAALVRWGSPDLARALVSAADCEGGKRLIIATLDALPAHRADALEVDLLDELARSTPQEDPTQWMADLILHRRELSADELARALSATHPEVSTWLLVDYSPPTLGDNESTGTYDGPAGMQGLKEDLPLGPDPVPLSAVPRRSGASVLQLGLSIARSLAQHHNAGRVVHPTRDSVFLTPDAGLEVLAQGDAATSPRPLTEVPSARSDIYAAAVLLLELLLGRSWPRNLPAHKVIPSLRHVVPDLLPEALAPLDAALHPLPSARPESGLQWLVKWQLAARAQQHRATASIEPTAQVRVGYDTHIGRVKTLLSQTNQDALTVMVRDHQALVVVCDGISTANIGSGDVAASITTQVLGNLWEQATQRLDKATPQERQDFLERSLRMANQAVCEATMRFAGGQLEGRVPMGTTAIVAMFHGNDVQIATLGDSRVYLVGPYGASLITADQNQAGERIKSWMRGEFSWWDPSGSALVGYIGHFDEWHRPAALPPVFTRLRLLPGERLFMSSDGITDYVGHAHPEVVRAIEEGLAGRPVDEAAREMVNRANRGGGGDNLTATVVELI